MEGGDAESDSLRTYKSHNSKSTLSFNFKTQIGI